jgi:hypothetical protein
MVRPDRMVYFLKAGDRTELDMERALFALLFAAMGTLFIVARKPLSRSFIRDQNATWGLKLGARHVASGQLALLLMGVILIIAAVLVLVGVLPV